MSDSDHEAAKEELRTEFRKAVDEEIDPIYQDVVKLLDMDGRLLHTLGELKRGRQLTIREQGLLQNILYGLISTQGDIAVNLLKTLLKVKNAQCEAFEREYAFTEVAVNGICQVVDKVITPLAQETDGTRQIAESLHQQFEELSKQKREMELKVPTNIEKELKAWVQERERAKKASEKYTG